MKAKTGCLHIVATAAFAWKERTLPRSTSDCLIILFSAQLLILLPLTTLLAQISSPIYHLSDGEILRKWPESRVVKLQTQNSVWSGSESHVCCVFLRKSWEKAIANHILQGT
ncbi:uncharacterized protein LOC144615632 [Panthera onca]